MITDPNAIAIIGTILTVIGLLIVAYFKGRANGEKKNGYVTQSMCNDNMDKFTKEQKSIHEKIEETNKCVYRIEGYLQNL